VFPREQIDQETRTSVLLSSEEMEPFMAIRRSDWLGDRWTSIPSRDKDFHFFMTFRPDEGPTQPPIHWGLGGGSLPGVKRLGREAEFKNGEAVPPLHHTSSWQEAIGNFYCIEWKGTCL
jgi:hypothetical protein